MNYKKRLSILLVILAVSLVALGVEYTQMGQWNEARITLSSKRAPVKTLLIDNFSSYPTETCYKDGDVFGKWASVFNGYGCTKIEKINSVYFVHQSPQASTLISDTHASLTTGPSYAAPITFEASLTNIAQLRQNSPPQPWEVGWVIWNYSDNEHFYYFIPKTNGWELGKRDPSYGGGQRFLATGTNKVFSLGVTYKIKIVHDKSNTMSVYVDGALITTFTDSEGPYSLGKIGLYNEDAHVHFTNVKVTQP